MNDFEKMFIFDKYIKVNSVDNRFLLERKIVDHYTGQNSNIMIIDQNNNKMFLSPFDLGVPYQIINGDSIYKIVNDTRLEVPEWTQTILNRWHWSWYNELESYFNNKEFKNLNAKLNIEPRKTKTVCPAKENVYKAFEINYFDTWIVIIGERPDSLSNGLAYCSDNDAVNRTLTNVFEEVITNGGYVFAKDSNILLLNKHLTNIGDWTSFFNIIVELLNKRESLTWLLHDETIESKINADHRVYKIK